VEKKGEPRRRGKGRGDETRSAVNLSFLLSHDFETSQERKKKMNLSASSKFYMS